MFMNIRESTHAWCMLQSDYCCDGDCTYCGPYQYCVNHSPMKDQHGTCSPSYRPVGKMCPNLYKACPADPNGTAWHGIVGACVRVLSAPTSMHLDIGLQVL